MSTGSGAKIECLRSSPKWRSVTGAPISSCAAPASEAAPARAAAHRGPSALPHAPAGRPAPARRSRPGPRQQAGWSRGSRSRGRGLVRAEPLEQCPARRPRRGCSRSRQEERERRRRPPARCPGGAKASPVIRQPAERPVARWPRCSSIASPPPAIRAPIAPGRGEPADAALADSEQMQHDHDRHHVGGALDEDERGERDRQRAQLRLPRTASSRPRSGAARPGGPGHRRRRAGRRVRRVGDQAAVGEPTAAATRSRRRAGERKQRPVASDAEKEAQVVDWLWVTIAAESSWGERASRGKQGALRRHVGGGGDGEDAGEPVDDQAGASGGGGHAAEAIASRSAGRSDSIRRRERRSAIRPANGEASAPGSSRTSAATPTAVAPPARRRRRRGRSQRPRW